MAEFFRSQMDYIFFGYGLAFILLVPVCHFLNRRPRRRLPWVWLGLFGAAHGLNEWLDLVALSLGTNPVFDSVRLGLMALSFVFLVEFGRIGTLLLRGRGPARWILAALLGVAALGGFAGLSGLWAASRYALGLVGGLWAAGALYLASRDPGPGKLTLLGAALGMVAYALATGLVVNPAPFFPASLVNATAFFTATGLPIQLMRGLLALWICACLCLLAQVSLAQETDRRIRVWGQILIAGAAFAVIALLVAGWFATQYFGDEAFKDIRLDQESRAKVLCHSRTDKMEETNHLVSTMAGSPWIHPGLENREFQAMEQTNSVLDRYSQALPGSVCYLMDLSGVTIASSNRHQPDSFVGKSYKFWPYFQEAVKGKLGRYWALGVTSKEMGYYASSPVRDSGGRIVGVAVFKRPLGEIQEAFAAHSLGFVIDSQGIVVMANRPGMVLKSLWPLSPETRKKLLASLQFGPGPFTPILTQEPVNQGESLFLGKRQMVLRTSFPWEDWSIVILSPVHPIVLARLMGIAITLFVCLAVTTLLTIIGLTIDATARIQSSESRYRLVFENTPVGILQFDKTGTLIDCNEKFAEIIGAPKEKVLRFNMPRQLQNEKLREAVLASMEGRYGFYEGDYLSVVGGKMTSVRAIFQGILSSTNEFLGGVGIFEDITDRLQAEKALKESDKRFRDITENAAEWVWEVDPQGKYTYSSSIVEQLLGYKPEEIIGKHFYDLLLPEEREKLKNASLALFAAKQPFGDYLNPNLHKNGGVVWFSTSGVPFLDEQGNLLGYRGAAIDITRRRRAEEELKKSVSYLEDIINSSADPIGIVDADGNFTIWNKAAETAYGYNFEDLQGKSFKELYADNDQMNKMMTLLRRDGFVQSYEIDMKRKDGSILPFSLSIKILLDDDDKNMGSVCVARDLSTSKKNMTELQTLNEKLQVIVQELEQRNREMALINSMTESLQTCHSVEETHAIIGQFARKLFPARSGTLFAIDSARNLVETAYVWGEPLAGETVFTLDDCWALRRGQMYLVENHEHEVRCRHFPNSGGGNYLCLPLIAQGEVMEMLHLQGLGDLTPAATESLQRRALMVADQSALALVNIRLRDNLRHQAIRDDLTGLFNRRYLEETLEREIHRSQRKETSLGLIMLDLDRFKQFNDTYGHEAGDHLLRTLGDFLQSHVRGGDIACRYGGEEFVLILPEADAAVTLKRAEELRLGVEALPVFYRGQQLGITVSLGVAVRPQHGESGETLLRAADQALYAAKEQGRNQVVMAESGA